jgi:hypothetical protein
VEGHPLRSYFIDRCLSIERDDIFGTKQIQQYPKAMLLETISVLKKKMKEQPEVDLAMRLFEPSEHMEKYYV